MTFGYWFWLGVGCVIGALALLRLTGPGRSKPRTTRTIHAVALFALLAFGGFKCAREEYVRADLLTRDEPVYTIARTRTDGGGLTYHKDKMRVEAVEYAYTLNGSAHSGLGAVGDAYTIERDFFAPDFNGRCLLIRVAASRPEISRISAVLNVCPPVGTVPVQGWQTHSLPADLPAALSVDTLWWRGQ